MATELEFADDLMRLQDEGGLSDDPDDEQEEDEEETKYDEEEGGLPENPYEDADGENSYE